MPGVARVVLNRPDKRNCLNEALVAAWFEALDIVRADRDIKAVITKGAGICFSSGLDLHFLRKVSEEPRDWDRPTPTVQMAEALRGFPRIVIAQVHGYCLGGALGIMNCHDLVFAADDAQLGMPEILRGSFGAARHLDAGAWRHPDQEGRIDAARRPQYFRRRGRPLGHRLAGRAGCGAEIDGDRHRPRNLRAPPGAAGALQDHRADGPRSVAVAGDPARSAGLRAACAASWTRPSMSIVSEVAEGRAEFGIQAAGCLGDSWPSHLRGALLGVRQRMLGGGVDGPTPGPIVLLTSSRRSAAGATR